MKERRTRAMARAAGWPFPTCPSPGAPHDVFKEWLRLYKRLRWALGHEVDVINNGRPGSKLARLKREARMRGIEVTLTRDQYETLLASRVCSYCGAALPMWGHAVDRIDSSLGYTADNVVAACDTCNRVKADIFTFDQMLEIGQLLRRWRAGGRWTDPGRRQPGGRPRAGNLREEIEAWNREHGDPRTGQRILSALLEEDGSGQA